MIAEVTAALRTTKYAATDQTADAPHRSPDGGPQSLYATPIADAGAARTARAVQPVRCATEVAVERYGAVRGMIAAAAGAAASNVAASRRRRLGVSAKRSEGPHSQAEHRSLALGDDRQREEEAACSQSCGAGCHPRNWRCAAMTTAGQKPMNENGRTAVELDHTGKLRRPPNKSTLRLGRNCKLQRGQRPQSQLRPATMRPPALPPLLHLYEDVRVGEENDRPRGRSGEPRLARPRDLATRTSRSPSTRPSRRSPLQPRRTRRCGRTPAPETTDHRDEQRREDPQRQPVRCKK